MPLFIKAIINIGRWDYSNAIPTLETYCQLPDLEDYRRQVGLVNLIACLTHMEDFEQAETIHQQLEKQLEGRKNIRLQANLLELKTQRLVHQDRLGEAEEHIKDSEAFLANDPSLDKFFY